MDKKIILNCMPPYQINGPSPALSILKSYLIKNGYQVSIKYWNVLLNDFEKDFTWNKSGDLTTLYAAYLAVKTQNNTLYKEVKAILQTIFPVMLNESYFYDSHIKKYTRLLEDFLDNCLNTINFNNILYFGFSMKTHQWILSTIIAEKIKEREPSIPIVIGGIDTEGVAKAFLVKFKQFDFAIWGEGEVPLLELSHFLSTNSNIYSFNVTRAYYRDENIVKKTSKKKHGFIDLSKSNFYPDFDDFFYNNALKKNNMPSVILIEGSRGCHWNRCNFCYLNNGYQYRQKDITKISQEIRYVIRKYNIFQFEFVDNDIIGKDIYRFHSLLNDLLTIKKEYPGFTISAIEVITHELSQETIKLMMEAGIINIQIGYESPSNSLLQKINKKNTFASNLNTIKHCFNLNIMVSGINVIYNLLEEDDEDIYESIENLRFFRFILKTNGTVHRLIPLAVNASSKYYKSISDNKQEYIPSLALYEKAFIDCFDDETMWHLFSFYLNQKNTKWDYFIEIQNHYLKNKYEYRFILENNKVIYQEKFNNVVSDQIEFDNNDICLKILKYCYEKPISIIELNTILLNHDIFRCEIDVLKENINILYYNGLVYRTHCYSEIVSIVKCQF